MNVILGAGLAGLSASYHLGHDNCTILERTGRPFGHISSTCRDGFTWDQGPHVSFTKQQYVRELFEASTKGRVEEFEAVVGNYYKGAWIDHPAQTSLYQVPEPERSACLEAFLSTRGKRPDKDAANYGEWLTGAFGPTFAQVFAGTYTQKYWTCPPDRLSTEWIGSRIHYPNVDDVITGASGPLKKPFHYITNVRYPTKGGYQAFADSLKEGSHIIYGAEVISVDLDNKKVLCANGTIFPYTKLINTLPLPVFIRLCTSAPSNVLEAAMNLACSQLLLVNTAVPHPALRPEHWIYVYDSDKLATRINHTEKLSQNNAPDGWCGIQTEVYFSRFKPLSEAPDLIEKRIKDELIEMGLVDPLKFRNGHSLHQHVKMIPWANVIFTLETASMLDVIWSWLEEHGLARSSNDTHPLTDWTRDEPADSRCTVFMAGRFGQWKYFWSDDCVMRGRQIAALLN